VITCGSCGAASPERFKFCPECGAALLASGPIARERKVVTTLFCDLVGFTALSEASDPEDLDVMLARYFAVSRTAIEAFGGVVEKFIGDAVVGVFGFPAVHEDDPERAVRSGLRIAEAAAGLTQPDGSPLRLRVGVNTGEVFVRLDVTPSSGEGFVTGDAVNTAARIQSVAPVMGVAVGKPTFEATRELFDYVALQAATLKGKSERVEVWQAVAPLARLGAHLTRRHESPLVGREHDLALLEGLFDKTRADSSPHLVTVTGEPGLGKSRLVAELIDAVSERHADVTWRRGHCLPYGENITFWALGEIVKTHARIYDTDPTDIALAKLDSILPQIADRDWLRERLLPLLGMDSFSRAEQSELFAAWRRFIESIAESGPTILVFEDLHWAEPALLTFIERLASTPYDLPLMLVTTARPEFLEHRSTFGQGLRKTALHLTPLSDDQTTELVAALLQTLAVPDDMRGALVQRSGGNPLFAEEYTRLLQDQGLIERVNDTVRLRAGAELPLPDSVHALIASRLDLLPAERKALLADAAVVGTTFWAGAVAAIGRNDETDVIEGMRDLARKDFIRTVRDPSMIGQTEYEFWHVLTRDVAYAQLPRASRAGRHYAAGQWLESQSGARAEDQADVLAHHYVTALDLALARKDDRLTEQVRPKAARFLLIAGERALAMDATIGFNDVQRALSLIPDDDPLRGRAMASFGKAAFHTHHFGQAEDALEQAVELLRREGDVSVTVDTLFELAKYQRRHGDARWASHYPPMLELIDDLPRGPIHVRVFTYHSCFHTLRGMVTTGDESVGHYQAAIDYANQAISLASELELDFPAEALGWRGHGRRGLDDLGGLDDIREAIRLGTPTGQRFVGIMYQGLSYTCREMQGPLGSRPVLEQGIAYAQAHGLTEIAFNLSLDLLGDLLYEGATDELLSVAERLAAEAQAGDDDFQLTSVRLFQSAALVTRGQADEAATWLDHMTASARDRYYGHSDLSMLGVTATAYAALGQPDTAIALFTDMTSHPETDTTGSDPEWTRVLISLDRIDLAYRLLITEPPTYWWDEFGDLVSRASLAEAEGDHLSALTGYADAAEKYRRLGVRLEQAFALLGQGRCLLALDRPDDAIPVLERARDMFATMGARPALAETDALLAKVSR
jgi:class 3 adenylate cyclase/tetratricopeptide (TPR) repeat protein